jgi:transposase
LEKMPPKISHYKVFCAIMYVLRTGIPWRNLPKCYGCWHTIYQRFKRGSEKGIWWKILIILQQSKKLLINIVITDSTTFKLYQHSGRLKGGCKAKEKVKEE